jgi:Tol biopolymer transport system component
VIVATGLDGTAWTVDAKNGNREILFQSLQYKIDSVRYSPDGHWLAFVGREGGKSTVFALPVTDAGPAADNKFVPISDMISWNDAPVFSDDSRRIIFRSNRDSQYCIWEVHLTNGRFMPNSSPSIVRHFHTYRSHLNSVSRAAFSISIFQRQMYLPAADLRGTIWLARVMHP